MKSATVSIGFPQFGQGCDTDANSSKRRLPLRQNRNAPQSAPLLVTYCDAIPNVTASTMKPSPLFTQRRVK
jgi:hypothetical protein